MHYHLVDEQAKRHKVIMVHQNRLKRYHGPLVTPYAREKITKSKDKATQTKKKPGRPRKVLIQEDSNSLVSGKDTRTANIPLASKKPTRRSARIQEQSKTVPKS